MKIVKSLLVASLFFTLTHLSAAEDPSPWIGVVNFRECMETSKLGIEGKESLESLKEDITNELENIENTLKDISEKLSDSDYIDGLSDSAEFEMKEKFRNLNEEYARKQNASYQAFNQANLIFLQNAQDTLNTAALAIAQEKGFKIIVNEDACFFSSPSLNITPDIIIKMDEDFITKSDS